VSIELPPGASEVVALAGGDINAAYRLRLADGRLAFCKCRADARAGEYAREARDLAWLAAAGALPLPAVLELGERYLALEWIERGSLSSEGEQELGRGLAKLHLAGAPWFGDPDGPGSTGFGSLMLPNDPAPSWPQLYAAGRLEPLARRALESGSITRRCAQAVAKICSRIEELCGPPEPPARLHGDLWSGNILADAGGHPWLIDPAAYGGHREVDLAMLRLFGGPSERCFAAYEECAPLAEGWRERVPLYQLAPLLVHAALFGSSYGAAAERAALAYCS
jgi:fructosamine-3-kinase